MTGSVALAVFGVWLALSVARQPRWSGSRVLQRWDRFVMLPRWSVFTRPPGLDFTFRFRCRRHDGTISNWHEAFGTRRPWGSAIWHPQLMVMKITSDVGNSMLGIHTAAERQQFIESPLYGVMTRAFCADDRAAGAEALQFLVTGSRGHEPETPNAVVFLSRFESCR